MEWNGGQYSGLGLFLIHSSSGCCLIVGSLWNVSVCFLWVWVDCLDECLGCLLLAGPPPTHWSGRAPCQMRLSDFSPESPCIQRFRTVAATVRQLPTIRQHPDGEWITKSILKHYSDHRSTPRCRYIRRSECWPIAGVKMTVSAIRSMTTHPLDKKTSLPDAAFGFIT